jgi:hypothetical protein
VVRLAVVHEVLAVVGDDEQRRVLEVATDLQGGEQPAQLVIGGRDLGDVRVAAYLLEEARLGLEGRVGVEHVDPQEETSPAVARREPGQRRVDHGARLALDVAAGLLLLGVRRLIVEVEALVEPELLVEHGRRHEGGRLEARLARALGQRHGGGRERGHAVVAHPVSQRVEAGHHRGVRGHRERRDGAAPLVACALRGQPVEVRRGGRGATVHAQRIAARGVERDQHGVARRALGQCLLDGAGRQRERQQEREPADLHAAQSSLLAGRTPM